VPNRGPGNQPTAGMPAFLTINTAAFVQQRSKVLYAFGPCSSARACPHLRYFMVRPARLLSLVVRKFSHVLRCCKEEKAMKYMRFCIHNMWPYLRTPVLRSRGVWAPFQWHGEPLSCLWSEPHGTRALSRPFRAFAFRRVLFPGRCPGLEYCALQGWRKKLAGLP